MARKQHRLFTRWFSRRIDLGVLLSGCLFVFIWALLPVVPEPDDQGFPQPGMQVQPTALPLSALPPYLRPDLVLIPSGYAFAPVWEISDALLQVPPYRYQTSSGAIGAVPEGMGSVEPLVPGLLEIRPLLGVMPPVASGQPLPVGPRTAQLHAHLSAGLGQTHLRTDDARWAVVQTNDVAWEFSFWIAFDREAGESTVFIEERSGDSARDRRLLRLVSRPDMWEAAAGLGTVWLRYQPGTGENDADQEN